MQAGKFEIKNYFSRLSIVVLRRFAPRDAHFSANHSVLGKNVRAYSSVVERYPDKIEVEGSIPSMPTTAKKEHG